MRKVLLVANHSAMNRNMLRWALVLARQGLSEPIILSTSGSIAAQAATTGLPAGLNVVYPPAGLGWPTGAAAPAGASTLIAARGWPAIRRRIRDLLPAPLEKGARFGIFLGNTLRNTRRIRLQISYVRSVLRELGIDVVLLSESSPAYDAPIFIAAAAAERIPVVTAPIDHYGRLDHAELYLTDKLLGAERGLNRLVARLYPRWAVTYKGRQLLRLQPELALPLEWLGLASPAPWRMVGVCENTVAVTSDAMRDFFIEDGVSPERLHVVGSPELDLMAQAGAAGHAGREELCAGLGLDPVRPTILTALVANHYLHGRPEAEYATYAEMVEGWVRPLGEIQGFNVIVTLHPSQPVETFRYIEDWGVRISPRDITQLIPFTDMFVGMSSTARLAIAAGKPVVYYDVFRYSSAMPTLLFKGLGGTFNVNTAADYRSVISQLTQDKDFYRQAVEAQQASADAWGPVDGESATRLARLFDEVVGEGPGRTPSISSANNPAMKVVIDA